MNIFTNKEEGRLRAGWRLAAQLFLMFLIAFSLILILDLQGTTALTISFAVGAVASMVMAARGLDRRRWRDYGLRFNSRALGEYGIGILLAGGVMGLIFLTEYLAGWVTITGYGWQVGSGTSFPLAFGGYFLFMVVVGVYEEMVFRGYQIVNLAEGLNGPGMTRRQAVWSAVAISSVVFGLMHALNPNATWISTLFIALAGVMLALPFVVTGRLSLSIGLHIGWNFFQGGVFGFPVSGAPHRASLLQLRQQGPEWLTGAGFGPEGGLLGLAGMLLIVLSLYRYLGPSGEPTHPDPELGLYTPSPRHYPA